MIRSHEKGLTGAEAETLLYKLTNADLQSTSDQTFVKIYKGNNYVINNIVAVSKSGGASVSCVGGIYTGANKTGSALVAASQSWLGLSALGRIVKVTLASILSSNRFSDTPILSLTVGSTAAATADIYIYGIIVD